MRKSKHLAFLLILITCLSFSFHSKANKKPESQFIELTVLPTIFTSSPWLIENYFKHLALLNKGLDKNKLKALEKRAHALFNSKSLFDLTRNSFSRQIAEKSINLGKLNKELESNNANEILATLNAAINDNEASELISYHEKIVTEPPQTHRIKIAGAIDHLNHLSTWQNLLIEQLNLLVQNELGNNTSLPDNKTSLQTLKNYNQHYILFSFRTTPSLDIIPYLDTLAVKEYQYALNLLEEAYIRSLQHRQSLKIKIH